MNKLLVICGLTATGKTTLAMDLAQQFNGEVISIDSRQAYKYMDIGTGKDLFPDSSYNLIEEIAVNNDLYRFGYYSAGSQHIWLYDVANPDQPMHVGLYFNFTWKAIELCWQRQKLPILVGGDGFYLKTILNPPETLAVTPNDLLRQELDNEPLIGLQQRLQQLNHKRWLRMNESDRQNSRRLIRAIEVAMAPESHEAFIIPKYESTMIGLSMTRIEDRIKDRVLSRLQHGFEREIEQLLKLYLDFYALPGSRTLGYAQWQAVIETRVSREDGIQQWIQAEVAYAKRQITWFKKQPSIQWIDVDVHKPGKLVSQILF